MFSIFEITMPSASRIIFSDLLDDSTVTFDTLVRAGVKTSSSYVPEITDGLAEAEPAPAMSPPAAKCSRALTSCLTCISMWEGLDLWVIISIFFYIELLVIFRFSLSFFNLHEYRLRVI
jgi:hypothetical protein